MRSRVRWPLLVVIVLAVIWVGFRLTEPGNPSSATHEPDTAEITEGVRHLARGARSPEGVIAARCIQKNAIRWNCAVRFADGSRGTVVAIWYGAQRAVGFSFTE